MRLKLLLVLLCLGLFPKLHSQPLPVTIKYVVDSKMLTELSIQKLGLKSNLNYDPDLELKLFKPLKGVFNMYINSNGLFKIGDGWGGHMIYLEQRDSVMLRLTEIPNIEKLLEKKYYPSFNTLQAVGKHAWHYTFFDELYRRTEKLHKFDMYVHLNDPMLFKNNCDKALLIGQNLIDSLYKKGKISNNFRMVAGQELNAIYVSWMCAVLSRMEKDNIDTAFFDKLNTMHFNDSVYAVQCNDYMQAGALYTYYIHNSYDHLHPYSNLRNELNSIMNNYSGIVRDRLLGWQIQDYIGKDYPAFDSCYKVFLMECKNEKIRDGVIKKVNSFVKPIKNISSILFSNLVEQSMIQTPDNKTTSLKNILNDSLVTLIDCWASWCSPCKAQMPFVHDLEKKYAGKMKVIYLSFDKDENKWKSFLNKNNLSTSQYLMDNDFSSAFSQYFDLQIIPRYLLIAKNGIKVLNAQMPLPALKEEFETELKKYLE